MRVRIKDKISSERIYRGLEGKEFEAKFRLDPKVGIVFINNAGVWIPVKTQDCDVTYYQGSERENAPDIESYNEQKRLLKAKNEELEMREGVSMRVIIKSLHKPDCIYKGLLGKEFEAKFGPQAYSDTVSVKSGDVWVPVRAKDCVITYFEGFDKEGDVTQYLSQEQRELIKFLESSEIITKNLNKDLDTEEPLNFDEIMKALSEGKKLTRKHYSFIYQPSYPRIRIIYNEGTEIYIDDGEYPKFNPINIEKLENLRSVSIVGYGSGKSLKVEYIYANPQMNRIVARIENGKEVDYDIDLFSIQQGGVILYKEPIKDTPIEVTLDEIETLFGHKVKIVKTK